MPPNNLTRPYGIEQIRQRITTRAAERTIARLPADLCTHLAELALTLTCAAPAIMLAMRVAIGGAA